MTDVAAIDLVSDLVELERLAAAEEDDDRRRRLLKLRERLAARGDGAKVSEAASVLGLSVPTVRSWVAAGVLQAIPRRQPARITYDSLALAKHALDELRRHKDDRPLLIAVMRRLRDQDALDDPLLPEALEDLAHGRVREIGPDDLDDLIPGSRRRPSA
jgi:excisionase family DNA binding protein